MSIRSIAALAAAPALVLALVGPPAHAAAAPAKAPVKSAAKSRPAAAIATVFGQPITKRDFGPVPPVLEQMAGGDKVKLEKLKNGWEDQALTGLVLGVLLDRYGKKHAIQPSAVEVSEVLAVMAKVDPTAGAPAPPDTTDESLRGGAAGLVGRFKIHAALFKEYGGRVLIDRQAGPLPFDAYRRLLDAEQKAGSFTVTPAWKTRFWAPFAADASRQFLPAAEAKRAISEPWWQQSDAR